MAETNSKQTDNCNCTKRINALEKAVKDTRSELELLKSKIELLEKVIRSSKI